MCRMIYLFHLYLIILFSQLYAKWVLTDLMIRCLGRKEAQETSLHCWIPVTCSPLMVKNRIKGKRIVSALIWWRIFINILFDCCFQLELPACASKDSVCADWSFCFAQLAWKSSHVAYMSPPTLYVLFAVHRDIDSFNVSWPCPNTNLARIPTRFVLGFPPRVDRTLHLECAYLDLDECVEVCRYRNVILVIQQVFKPHHSMLDLMVGYKD